MRLIDDAYIESYSRVFKEVLERSAKGFYDDSALPSYTHRNRLMSWLFWKRIDTVLSMMGDLDGKSVLDFGCGGGVMFKYLHEHNCRIVGCDNQAHRLAREVCSGFGIEADVYGDLFEIKGMRFDLILALDVFEHIEDLGPVIDRLLELSHERTEIIISGPTESLPYRMGRWLAGFKGHYHVKNIYDVEREFRGRGLKEMSMRKLYPPFTLFRVSSWVT